MLLKIEALLRTDEMARVCDQGRCELLRELAGVSRWVRTVSSGSQEAMKINRIRAKLMRCGRSYNEIRSLAPDI